MDHRTPRILRRPGEIHRRQTRSHPDGLARRVQGQPVTAVSRRDFLSGAALLPFVPPARANNCILLVLTGGPSHLDTWDMKPEAPREIRGPFRPIRTNVPGIEISEIFPRMAKHADKYMLVRAVYSDS